MFVGLRFSAVAGTDLLTFDLSAIVEVRTLYGGFEGHTKRSLTRMRGPQGTSWLVLGGPFHIREARVFGGRGDRFVDVRPQRQRDTDRGGENII